MVMPPLGWVIFTAGILAILLLDLGVFHREAHAVSTREAGIWTGVWVSLALAFNGFIYWRMGAPAALEFFTGYLVEYSLSVDNIFIFILIFSGFQVPDEYRHRVLFWGILGALIMRGALIFVGAALVSRFEWILYVFGAFLLFTGVKMALDRGEAGSIGDNRLLTWLRRVLPITEDYHGQKFLVRRGGRLWATPLFVVLVLVEASDVMFALDSIPAIFGITRDPFIVFASNVFAILGLRSLYFLLGGIMGRFRYLKYGLAGVLAFIGIKMIASFWFDIPTFLSLGIVGGILAASVAASLVAGPPEDDSPSSDSFESSGREEAAAGHGGGEGVGPEEPQGVGEEVRPEEGRGAGEEEEMTGRDGEAGGEE